MEQRDTHLRKPGVGRVVMNRRAVFKYEKNCPHRRKMIIVLYICKWCSCKLVQVKKKLVGFFFSLKTSWGEEWDSNKTSWSKN